MAPADWSLQGGAQIVSGNSPFYSNSATDTHSVSIPKGASATTGTMCIGKEHPTLRFFAKNDSSALSFLDVQIQIETSWGRKVSLPVGLERGNQNWEPSSTMRLIVNYLNMQPAPTRRSSSSSPRATATGRSTTSTSTPAATSRRAPVQRPSEALRSSCWGAGGARGHCPNSTELARAPRLINGPSRLSLAALAAAFASLLLAAPALAAPPNDDFADADVLPGAIPATAQGTTVSGTTVDATTEAGQPEAGEAVWYRWTPTVSQTVIFDLCGPGSGSGLQHKVNVYTGAALGSLTPQSPTGSPSSFPCASNAGSAADQESYAVTAGTTYQIAVQPYFFGTPRGFDLRLRTLPPNDNFANRATIAAGPLPISVTGYNVGATAEAGEPLHAGLTPRRTVWYSWTPTTSGFASIQTCSNWQTETNLDTVIGVYTDTSPAPALTDLDPEASGDNGCTDSGLNRRSTVSIAYTALTTYYIAVGTKNTGFPDTEYGTFELRIVPPAARANDNFANRQTLTRSNVGATPVAGTIAGATAEGGEPSHGPVATHTLGLVPVDARSGPGRSRRRRHLPHADPVRRRRRRLHRRRGERAHPGEETQSELRQQHRCASRLQRHRGDAITRSRSTGPTPARREPSVSRFTGYRRTTISRTASRSRPGTRA